MTRSNTTDPKLAPSHYEALFVGLAHDDKAIEQTIDAAGKAFKAADHRK